VTRRVQGEPITVFPPARSRARDGVAADDFAYLPPDLAEPLRLLLAPPVAPPPPAPATLPPALAVPAGGRAGALRALCIGIDAYRHITPLQGCRNDAENWRQVFTGLGYDAKVMPQEEATAEGLIQRFGDFVHEARAGDTFLLQFSGHGTQFADATGDEEEGLDEAICAIDCGGSSTVGLVLDDQFRDLLGQVAEGATLVCFFDSCHSGTVTRARFDRRMGARSGGGGINVRRFPPNAAMRQAYADLVRRLPVRRNPGLPMREVVFSACQPGQSAYERDGQGDFTRYAIQTLRRGGARPTNSGFMNAVARLFAGSALQMPYLECDPGALEAPISLGAWT
jgi:hypothetical protein